MKFFACSYTDILVSLEYKCDVKYLKLKKLSISMEFSTFDWVAYPIYSHN